MNIEIANRFVQLRKQSGLSQEQLAEKIGVSRQAVSKWERSEASPDTDNLILLARLYNVSLDELLKTDDDIPAPSSADEPETSGFTAGETAEAESAAGGTEGTGEKKSEYVNIGWDGIHVEDGEDSVHIDGTGIHIREKHGDTVNIDRNGVYVNGKQYTKDDWPLSGHESAAADFPFAIICIIAYICMGFFMNLWHPGWLIFFLIPLFHGIISAIKHRNGNKFPYAVLALGSFLLIGFMTALWHPAWVIFLTIPIYHWIFSSINKARRRKRGE